MPINIGSSSISSIYLGSSEITKVYLGSQLVYKKSTGTPLSELPVGTTIYTTVNNVRSPFLIIHQGNPNASYYGAGGAGTWLMYRDSQTLGTTWINSAAGTASHLYDGKNADTLVNTTFVSRLPATIQSSLHNVTIEAVVRTGGTAASQKGVITRKAFLPSYVEIGSPTLNSYYTWNSNTSNAWGRYTGTLLSYFSSNKYSPVPNASTHSVYTRSPFFGYDQDFTNILQGLGIYISGSNTMSMPFYGLYYVEPIMVVDDTLLVDDNMDVIL